MPPINQNAASDDATPDRLKVTIKDGAKVYVLDSDELGPADARVCRQETGLPLEHYLGNFGSDSMVAILWMARRKTGEPNLTYKQVEDKYPTNKSLESLDFDFKTEFDQDDEEVDPLVDADS